MSYLLSSLSGVMSSTFPQEKKVEKEYVSEYKKKWSVEHRTEEFKKISRKYPDRIPIVVERLDLSSTELLDKNKFLVPKDTTVGQFMYVVRKRIKLNPEESLFLFVNNTVPSMFTLVSSLYQQNKDIDGFLYIQYSGENTFG